LSRGEAHIRGYKSGLTGVDNYITTIHPQRLIILAARPSVGKTTLACNIGMSVAKRGGTVLFVSLEMAREELTEKMLATEAEVDTRSYQSGKFDLAGVPNDIERTEDAANLFVDRKMIIDDRSSMNAVQLRGLIRKVKSRYGCDLVIVDYLQLMQGRGKNNNDIYGEISRAMKCIAKDLDVPIIALSQMSRAVESEGRTERPRLSDLRDSGRLEQDADQVWFLVRDKENSPRVAQLQIAKHRQGPIGDVPLRFDPGHSLFTDGEWADHVEDEDAG
jgi:replicative DNA helicase